MLQQAGSVAKQYMNRGKVLLPHRCRPSKKILGLAFLLLLVLGGNAFALFSFFSTDSSSGTQASAVLPKGSAKQPAVTSLSATDFFATRQTEDSLKEIPVFSESKAEISVKNLGKNHFFVCDDEHGPLDFSLHEHGPGHGPTLFVVGGIQGDEPGGFSAASLLVTHYKITRGKIFVVPNLNFHSIVLRGRGLYGDMNRKFAALASNDPEFNTVAKIKELLLNPKVDAILNLHDGSGFYRPSWESAMRNPARWGQSVIIDQGSIGANSYGQLENIAEEVLLRTNSVLLAPDHKYFLKNTRTAEGDKEMEKTLTFFAIKNGKPAFGVEASKDFPLPVRAYYHLQVLESFMQSLGITFERNFELTPKGVAKALSKNLEVAFLGNHVVLPLEDVRPTLTHIPLRKQDKLQFSTTSPLLTVVSSKQNTTDLEVYYGNRLLTTLRPDYLDYDHSLQKMIVYVDGQEKEVHFGETIKANRSIKIKSVPNYRINAIGPQLNNGGSECGITLARDDFPSRFSLDQSGNTFRIEVYKQTPHKPADPAGNKPVSDPFAGMILVQFPDASRTAVNEKLTLPAVEGNESVLGY